MGSLGVLILLGTAGLSGEQEKSPESSYGQAVRRCVDTLVTCGQDTYGSKSTPVLVSILTE